MTQRRLHAPRCTHLSVQMEAFRERYDVVAVDLRGYGDSDRPKVGGLRGREGCCWWGEAGWGGGAPPVTTPECECVCVCGGGGF